MVDDSEVEQDYPSMPSGNTQRFAGRSPSNPRSSLSPRSPYSRVSGPGSVSRSDSSLERDYDDDNDEDEDEGPEVDTEGELGAVDDSSQPFIPIQRPSFNHVSSSSSTGAAYYQNPQQSSPPIYPISTIYQPPSGGYAPPPNQYQYQYPPSYPSQFVDPNQAFAYVQVPQQILPTSQLPSMPFSFTYMA